MIVRPRARGLRAARAASRSPGRPDGRGRSACWPARQPWPALRRRSRRTREADRARSGAARGRCLRRDRRDAPSRRAGRRGGYRHRASPGRPGGNRDRGRCFGAHRTGQAGVRPVAAQGAEATSQALFRHELIGNRRVDRGRRAHARLRAHARARRWTAPRRPGRGSPRHRLWAPACRAPFRVLCRAPFRAPFRAPCRVPWRLFCRDPGGRSRGMSRPAWRCRRQAAGHWRQSRTRPAGPAATRWSARCGPRPGPDPQRRAAGCGPTRR